MLVAGGVAAYALPPHVAVFTVFAVFAVFAVATVVWSLGETVCSPTPRTPPGRSWSAVTWAPGRPRSAPGPPWGRP
ncbi:hypothetical protein GCM10020295_22490 [Streptomyces cinereospinus]